MNFWRSLGFRASPYDANPLKPIPEDVELLVGRGDELIELCTSLESDTRGVYVISGKPGVGKTSFFNISQYLLENNLASCGPHLLCARTLCPIQPTDGPTDVAMRVVASLVKSVEDYCALSQRPIPRETEKISKWISGKGAVGAQVGITIVGFGGSYGKNISLPNFAETSFERFLDILTCIVSEVVEVLGFEGAFIVLDNIENLEEEKIAQLMMTFRDTLFITPSVWWIIIGQSGLASLLQSREPRVFERLCGPGLELRPIPLKELHAAIEKRVSRFHASGDGKAPLTEPVHDHLYKASHGEIRFVFKYGSDICMKFMTMIRTQVMKQEKRLDEKMVNRALGTYLIKSQIPDNMAERLLKFIVKEELSGLNLRKPDRQVLRVIGEKTVARASHYREFGFKTMQDFSANYLLRLHKLNLLVRTQEGRSVAYRLRGLSSLAAEYGILKE